VSAFRRHSELLPTALGCFSVATILHMVALVELWFGYGGLPLNNFFESASLCGFLIAVTFLLVYWRCQFAGLSVFSWRGTAQRLPEEPEKPRPSRRGPSRFALNWNRTPRDPTPHG
jgi:hypothetical protein